MTVERTTSIDRQVVSAMPYVFSFYKYMPVVILYFFFNSAGLPLGLTYCAILSPLFWFWLYVNGERWLTLKFTVCLLPFALAHLVDGIDSFAYYVRSAILLWATYVIVYAFCVALLKYKKVDRLFDQLIFLNVIAAAIAVSALVSPLRDFFWMNDSITFRGSGDTIYRLRLLTTEPSVYANLMLPLIVFVSLRLLRHPSVRNSLYLIMIGVPFALSQSFGSISMYVAGIGAAMLFMYRRSFMRLKTILTVLTVAAGVLGLVLIPSPISTRISQVVSGNDSSVDSRTISSFVVAQLVVAHKSMWWGVGLGQAKLVDLPAVGLAFQKAVIPNAVADTYAELGIVGVLLRFGVEVYLFWRTRVYENSFRLAMFVVAFILQLTGGYIEYVQEYLIWCFAFCQFFPEFNLPGRFAPRAQ